MWGKGNTFSLLVQVQTCTTTVEIGVLVSQKIGSQATSRPSNTTLGHIPRGCSNIPQEHLLNYVHSSTIYNSHNLSLDVQLKQESE